MLVAWLIPAPNAQASEELFGGVGDVVQGAFAIPMGTLAGTLGGPPVIGTMVGAVTGAFGTAYYTTRGAFRIAGSVIPLARAAAPFFLPFLF